MAQRSNSFAYGTRSIHSDKTPVVYPALISKVAQEIKQLVSVSDHVKDDIEYKNTFDGKEMVVSFCPYKIEIFSLNDYIGQDMPNVTHKG